MRVDKGMIHTDKFKGGVYLIIDNDLNDTTKWACYWLGPSRHIDRSDRFFFNKSADMYRGIWISNRRCV